MINNNIPTAENRDIKSLNGGRKITVDGKIIDVISGYSPAWTREYSDSFTTWDNRVIQKLKGIRFSLTISTYGLSKDDITALLEAAKKEKIDLVCDEFTGEVICNDFSAELQCANFYGDFSRTSIKFTAVSALAPDEGEGGL